MNQLKLRIAETGQEFTVSEGDNVILGRAGGGAQIEVQDPSGSISRKHLRIEFQQGLVSLTDLGSSNGTLVNGSRIEAERAVRVNPSDSISIGQCQLSFSFSGEIAYSNSSKNESAPIASNEPFESTRLSKRFLARIASGDRIKIGRSPENDIVTDPKDRTVGRWHAELTKENGSWYVTDLRSKNGVYVNDVLIKDKMKVGSGDDIYICLHHFNIEKGYRDLREEVAIQAKGMEKKFSNGYVGLKKLDLSIPYSKFIAVMGPSGCGKSTLLKALNGDNPASDGQVIVHGLDLVQNYNLIKKKIGYVPQDDIIHRDLTVEQTMMFSAKLRLPKDTPEDEMEKKIFSVLLSLFDDDKVKNIYHKRVHSLSGGERKRLSIAVELLTDPSILFLDEPTSPLDPESIHEFLTKLNNLKKTGTTIIMVTHKPEDLNYVDDVVFLGAGGYDVYYGGRDRMLQKFGKKSITEVYGLLSDRKVAEEEYNKKYSQNQLSQKYKKSDTSNLVVKKDSFFHQFVWLTRRYFQIKLNDKGNVALLIAQPMIIALLISIIFSEFQLGVIFLMAISSIWFGVSNAAKEIVGEQSIYKRERMFNLWINAYVLSKISVLSVISLIQLLLFESIIYFRFRLFPPEVYDTIYQHSFGGSLLFMLFLAISATLLGLWLSSIFDNTEKVMTVVPIALMPQIMLAGVITKIDNWGMELLSFLTLGRWGTEGLSRIQDYSVIEEGDSLRDNLESVIAYLPQINTDTIVNPETGLTTITQTMDPTETMVAHKSALKLLDFYNEELIEDGRLIGEVMNSMTSNLVFVMTLNIIIYATIYMALKKKDSI
jgi:ABC-type multidrug transport system ATPase subunit/pSer/pThr/pTyr-binding forkhead associated (FHA) protein